MLMKHWSRSLPSPLMLAAIICLFSGTVAKQAENGPHQVNGVLGGTAFLPVTLKVGKVARHIEWTFQNTSHRRVIAQFENGELELPNSRDGFGLQLERANETTLKIKDLKMEDAGKYKAHVKLGTTGIQDASFNLAVYEPVPEPKILYNLTRTPDRCNVTLQCQVSGNGGFNVTWKRGDRPLRAWEEGPGGWYQLSGNGRDLRLLLWPPSSSDSDFSCQVSNPADCKQSLVNLRSICPNAAQDS
ncbi:SLAM family member 5-like isoform X2 [Hemicordylus capensis]|uniref:SLAM family member 5-like isoform X2 n=1 Tax=Hemicordylus capensis TaxID=884348 RepID=UPI0023044E03|nr:SLAM family member 5-like isoform X2 [Hemicordylus capensis]